MNSLQPMQICAEQVASASTQPMIHPPAISRAVGRRGAFPLKLQHATSAVSAAHRCVRYFMLLL
jgi:hypothetical protein